MFPIQLKKNISLQNNFVTVYNEQSIFSESSKHYLSKDSDIQYKSKQGIASIPLNNKEEIVLVKKYYKELDTYLYVIPQGDVSTRNIEGDVKKITKKLTGHGTKEVKYIQRAMQNPNNQKHCSHVFILKESFITESDRTNTHQESTAFPQLKIKEMMENGQIIDSISLIALNIYFSKHA
jgi:hypothetical protein